MRYFRTNFFQDTHALRALQGVQFYYATDEPILEGGYRMIKTCIKANDVTGEIEINMNAQEYIKVTEDGPVLGHHTLNMELPLIELTEQEFFLLFNLNLQEQA